MFILRLFGRSAKFSFEKILVVFFLVSVLSLAYIAAHCHRTSIKIDEVVFFSFALWVFASSALDARRKTQCIELLRCGRSITFLIQHAMK
jgi:hypothetical protein